MPKTSSKPRPATDRLVTAPLYHLSASAVDTDKHTIRGAAICTEGEAQGHGYRLDDSFIKDVVKHGNKQANGVKVRFGHPSMSSTALGTFLGRAKHFRLDDSGEASVARADLFLSATAADTPSGDLRAYVESLAKADDEALGMSIVFTPGATYRKPDADGRVQKDSPEYATLERLHAADMVDDPAANPSGLLSAWSQETLAGQVTDFLEMHPEVFELATKHPEILAGFLAKHESYLERQAQAKGAPAMTDENANDELEQKPRNDETETDEPTPTVDGAGEADPDGQADEPKTSDEPDPAADARDDEDDVPADGGADSEQGTLPASELNKGRLEAARFITAFGDQGGRWYADGVDFNKASEMFTAGLQKRVTGLEAANADLTRRIASLSLAMGEADPIEFESDDDPDNGATELAILTEQCGDEDRAKRILVERDKQRAK